MSAQFTAPTQPTGTGRTNWKNGPAVKIVLLTVVFLMALLMNLDPVIKFPVKDRAGLGSFGDTYLYHTLAYNLYEGHGFSGTDDDRALGMPHPDKPLAYEPAATRGPVYPVFLWAVYKVFGNREAMASIDTWHINWDRVRIVQGVLNALTCLLVFGIVRLIWTGCFWPALTAALLSAGCFYNIYYARALLSESVTTFILTGFILVVVWALKTKRGRWWLVAGLLFGVVILARTEYLPLLLVVGGYSLWVQRDWPAVRNAVLFIGAALCTVAPWTIRNYCAFQQFVPVKVGALGQMLYLGTFESTKTWHGWGVIPAEVVNHPNETARVHALNESFNKNYTTGSIRIQQDDQAFMRLAIERIKRHPLDCLGNWVRKVPRLWYLDYIQMYPDREASGNWFLFYFSFAVLAVGLCARAERILAGPIWLVFGYLNLFFLPLHVEPRLAVALMPGIIALAGIGLGKVCVAIRATRSHLKQPADSTLQGCARGIGELGSAPMADQFATPALPIGASRRIRVIPLLLLLGVVGAYSNHFHNDFHFDDSHTIVNNAAIRDWRNIPRFFSDATTFSALPANQSYRPIVSTILAIDYRLGGGLDPVWFQLSGFLGFIALVTLLGLVVYRLLEKSVPAPRNVWLALMAAGWFGLHPANADTVNYIIACSDLFSTLAVLGSLALYQLWPGGRRTYLYLLPAAIGILAKPIAAMFAPLLAVYLLLVDEAEKPGVQQPLPRWLDYLRSIVPAFLVCGAVSVFVQQMTPKSWVAGAANAREYLITQPYVVLLYFKTFFWPSGLSADYDLVAFHTTDDPRFWAGFGFLVCLVVCAIWAAAGRRTRVTGFGLLWFLLALAPTSLCPLAEVMNSHRTFFPYAGLVIAVAGLAALLRRRLGQNNCRVKTALALGGVALFLCANGAATYQRNKVWRTEESLWRDVSTKSPENGRGLMNYGLTLMAKGDFQQALAYFYRAQRLTPLYSTLFINIAIAEGATDQPVKAEHDFKEALRLGPANPNSYSYYGRWLLAQARQAEAVALLQKALELSPGDLFAQGLLDSARAPAPPVPDTLRAGAVGSPEAALNQSLQHYNAQRYREAIAAAEAALQLRQGYAAAYNNICAAYNQLGQYAKAVAAGEQALRYQANFPLASNNLDYARQQLRAR